MPRAARHGGFARIYTLYQHLAGRWLKQAVGMPQQCALAGAVPPEQRDSLARADRQRDPAQRLDAARVAEPNVVDLDDRMIDDRRPYYVILDV